MHSACEPRRLDRLDFLGAGVKFSFVIRYKGMCGRAPIGLGEVSVRVGVDDRVSDRSVGLGKRCIAAAIVIELFPVEGESKLRRIKIEPIRLNNYRAVFGSEQVAPVDDVFARFRGSCSRLGIRAAATRALHSNALASIVGFRD